MMPHVDLEWRHGNIADIVREVLAWRPTLTYGSSAIPTQPKQAFPNELRNRAMSTSGNRLALKCLSQLCWLCVIFNSEFAPQVRSQGEGSSSKCV